MENRIIDILKSSEKELQDISRKNVLSLNIEEMTTIQKYFKRQKRNPTYAELETLAQTWSEHCKHKTLTGNIQYIERQENREERIENRKNKAKGKGKRERGKGKDKNKLKETKRTYKNLLKETVFKATQEIIKKWPKNRKNWCISVFEDNAGIIEFNKKYGVAFKVETHNHPSALEPYGGAATGIGGVIRDILGVGLGAKPIANTDIFCFGPPDLPWDELPKGVLHPKRIAKGVVSGVRDYGNRMGIPTVNGSVYFDEGYISNPLVYCGTVGLIPKEKSFKKVKNGDLILVVGGKTGRDGIHGATFSSAKLEKDTDATAVQIGNPIVEKKVLDTILVARDLGLYEAITDCGAGGLSSAIGELGSGCGAKVHLEKVPLKYEGLLPWEIWLSEAQERMVLAVPPKNKDEISRIFELENVEAVFVGEFTSDKVLRVLYNEDSVVQIDMDFLHNGVPKPTHTAIWQEEQPKPKKTKEVKKAGKENFGKDLKRLLSSLNICSREWIIRQYDHEVQGQTVVKPLHGATSGPGDASVLWPFAILGSRGPRVRRTHGSEDKGQGSSNDKDNYKGIVLANGLNPEYGKIDPYWMTASAIDEALRNIVCVGGDVEKTALLDNFCWGSPDRPEVFGGLVRAAQSCYDFSKVYQTPFISGKDSLHNEYNVGSKSFSIPPALLISAISVIDDVRQTITMNLKNEGNLLYIVGETKNELGGSQYNKIMELQEGNIPKVDAVKSRKTMASLSKAIRNGLVLSCHDCSEGGLAVAVSEMCLAGSKGAKIELANVPVEEGMEAKGILFSETNSRFVVEVNSRKRLQFEKIMKGIPYAKIGVVTGNNLMVKDEKGKNIISEKVGDLETSWKKTLNW